MLMVSGNGWIVKIKSGKIVLPERVFNEIVKGRDKEDELAKWVKLRKANGLSIKSSKDIDLKVTDDEPADYRPASLARNGRRTVCPDLVALGKYLKLRRTRATDVANVKIKNKEK